MNRFGRRLLLVIACSSLLPLAAEAAPAVPPFYVAASKIKPEGKLGQVVKKEKVATEISGAQAWRIAYISSDVNDLKNNLNRPIDCAGPLYITTRRIAPLQGLIL